MEVKELYEIKEDLEKLIIEVGKVVEEGYHQEEKEIEIKEEDLNNLLTKYDTKANRMIVEHLEKNYPTINIISEEEDDINNDSQYSFYVDPIDGTRNFTRRNPIFHVGIGLAKNEKPILCLTYNPILKEMFWAIKGEGAYLNNKKIKVIEREMEVAEIQFHKKVERKYNPNLQKELNNKCYKTNASGSCHRNLAGVAYGRDDALIHIGASSWDYCQYLLVEEAGGIVTDLKGKEYNINSKQILASNKTIHKQLVELINKK